MNSEEGAPTDPRQPGRLQRGSHSSCTLKKRHKIWKVASWKRTFQQGVRNKLKHRSGNTVGTFGNCKIHLAAPEHVCRVPYLSGFHQTTSEWSEWKSLSCVRLFATHGLYCPWNSLGQDIGEGSLYLLQVSHITGGIFTSWATREAQEYWSGYLFPFSVDLPDPGIEPGSLLHCRQTLYQLSYQGSPLVGHTIKTYCKQLASVMGAVW